MTLISTILCGGPRIPVCPISFYPHAKLAIPRVDPGGRLRDSAPGMKTLKTGTSGSSYRQPPPSLTVVADHDDRNNHRAALCHSVRTFAGLPGTPTFPSLEKP